MHPSWKELDNEAVLEQIDSSIRPTLLFKHSTRCGISTVALDRLKRGWSQLADQVDFFYLDLIRYRSVSHAIAERYFVAHESPQILLIAGGSCVFEASHLEINVDDIAEQLSLLPHQVSTDKS